MAELLPEAPIAEADGDTNFAENPYKARTHREEEGGDRERKESRKDRDRSDRDRGDRHRSDRDRDRDRDRKDRHKDRTRERDRDRSPKDKERRRRKSRSRSPKEPRRKRVSGFDQPPAAPLGFAVLNAGGNAAAMPGVTPQQAALASLASAAGIDIGLRFAATFSGDSRGSLLVHVWEFVEDATGTVAPQAMTQQATRHARRVYVGGLPPGANEQTVAKFFSQAIAAVGGTNSGGDSVVNVYINQEKKFAFVEFRTVEETSNAMALDGIMFEGASVRVRRPNDYNPAMAATLGPSTPNPNLNLAVIGLSQPGAVADGPDRIFVGGLPYYLTEEQCSELLGKFGAVRAFELVRDRETGNSKGYGFAVFEDPSVVDMACAGLNGVPMGDKTLTVRRATAAGQAKPDTDSVIAQAQQQIAMSMIGGGLPPANLNLPGMQLPGHNAAMPNMMPQMPGMLSSPPTRVVSLVDVVNVEELSDEVTYQEIKEDMQDECARYGTIASLEIPRPSSDGSYVGGFGKVFVQYENLEGSLKARNALNGRKFDGKVVKAEFYDESRFSAGDFS